MDPLIGNANRGSISTGYSLNNSLRFDNWYNYTGDETGDDYLYRTTSANAGFQSDISTQDSNDGQKWVLSFWCKRGSSWVGNPFDTSKGSHTSDSTRNQQSIMGGANSARYSYIGFNSTGATSSDDNQWDCFFFDMKVGSTAYYFQTDAQYRDYSAWYHFFIKCDTTQGTSTDRLQLWVNGVRVTSWQDYATIPQNETQAHLWADGVRHYWGRHYHSDGTVPFHGYISDAYFLHNDTTDSIDTAGYVATTFGEFNDNGIWIPIEADVEYGNQAYHLTFEDSSDLGKDTGGVGNHFESFSMSAVNQSTDTPSNNFATLIRAQNAQGGTAPRIKKGGLQVTNGGGSVQPYHTGMGMTKGKWYFEYTMVDNVNAPQNSGAGWIGAHQDQTGEGSGFTSLTTMSAGGNGNGFGAAVNGWGCSGAGATGNNSAGAEFDADQYSGNLAEGAVSGLAVDLDAGKMWFHISGTWFSPTSGNVGNPATGANPSFTNIASVLDGDYLIAGANHYTTPGYIGEYNFGNPPSTLFTGVGTYADGNGYGSFAYEPPSGFLAMCSKNLAKTGVGTTIDDPSAYFQTTLWEGTAQAMSITNDGNSDLQPDMVWWKRRDASGEHRIMDSSRGVTKYLATDSDLAEDTYSGYITSFNSNGFSIAVGDTSTNYNGSSYVAWNWKMNGGTKTTVNASGTQRAGTYQVNTTAGQSIITFTGDNTDPATVAHGLGKKPEFIIIKRRDADNTDWRVWHHRLYNIDDAKMVSLNSGGASYNGGEYHEDGHSSTHIKLTNSANVNNASDMYCLAFTSIEGYSRFGMFEGNMGDNHNVFKDGTFVYCGFKPAFVMVKAVDRATDWYIIDNKRKRNNNVSFENNGENSRWERLFPNSNAAQTSGYPATGGAGGGWLVDNGFMDLYSNGFKLRIDDAQLRTLFMNDDELYVFAAFAERPFVCSDGVPGTAV